MSKFKHTPGPWKGKDIKIYVSKLVSLVYPHYEDDEATANIQLISCCPELLEVMIDAYKCGEFIIWADRNKVRSIIERATGMTIQEVLK